MHPKLKRIWHSQTGLVFKSARERVVVCKVVNDAIQPLDDESRDLAKKWGFNLEENQVRVRVCVLCPCSTQNLTSFLLAFVFPVGTCR